MRRRAWKGGNGARAGQGGDEWQRRGSHAVHVEGEQRRRDARELSRVDPTLELEALALLDLLHPVGDVAPPLACSPRALGYTCGGPRRRRRSGPLELDRLLQLDSRESGNAGSRLVTVRVSPKCALRAWGTHGGADASPNRRRLSSLVRPRLTHALQTLPTTLRRSASAAIILLLVGAGLRCLARDCRPHDDSQRSTGSVSPYVLVDVLEPCLVMPGNFMVNLALIKEDGRAAFNVSRHVRPSPLAHVLVSCGVSPQASLAYRSPVSLALAAVSPLALLRSPDVQRLVIPLMESTILKTRSTTPHLAFVELGRQDAHWETDRWSGGGGEVQVYSARLRFHAHLTGLR